MPTVPFVGLLAATLNWSGVEEEVAGKIYDGRLMRRLLQYAWPYRTEIFFSLILLMVNSSVQVAGPLLTKLAVDRYLAPDSHRVISFLDPYLSTEAWTGISQISLIYLAATVIGLFSNFGQSYLMQKTGQLAMFRLRREIMEHLQRVDIAYYDRNPAGRLLTRVTTDIDALNELFASGLVAIIGDLLILLFLLLAMGQMSIGMTLILLAVSPVILLVTLNFRRQVQVSFKRIRVAVARINSYMQEHLTGMTVVQLFNREKRSSEEFAGANNEHMIAFKDSIHAYGWFYPGIEFAGVLGLVGLLSYGGYRIQNNELTLGVLVAFFQYGLRFYRPIQDLSEKYNVLQQAMTSAERVFDLLDTRPAIAVPDSPKSVPGPGAGIEFDHVWFAYKDEQWILRDLNLQVRPGETIAIVGHTGAGKTTITNLLLRFYDIQKGAIRIGGTDIRDVSPTELRKHFGVVLQDPYLFTGSIADNIRLGTSSITDSQIEEAARQVNLLDYIEALPGGFQHEVRERGAGLSTGQKQLVSFARALAHNPRFLILDEATSSVDTETEIRVREALSRLLEGRTSIVIAHRLSTIQRADRIAVMHKGELREVGTHQELLSRRGIYWKLYQLQYKDQEVSSSPQGTREFAAIPQIPHPES